MAGNTFGESFRVTTFGESHGAGLGAIVDGCPSGIALSDGDFEGEIGRRRPGKGEGESPRREKDRVEILSGLFEGKTTGTPITLLVRNRDVDSRPYEILRRLFRPGHGDYTYFRKYSHFDFRGGGRASARETSARVAAGVIARKILYPLGVRITAYTIELGGLRVGKIEPEIAPANAVCCPDREVADAMIEALARAKESGNSLGGIVEVVVSGCPAGLGEPVFDKLDADLAKAIMSVGAVKGVEVGEGFGAARLTGAENNDPITPSGFRTNHAGGILAGISNGEDIVLRAAVKPIPSIPREQDTIDRDGRPARLTLSGRFDVCAIPRIVPVLEAMAAIVLADHYLRNRTRQISMTHYETLRLEDTSRDLHSECRPLAATQFLHHEGHEDDGS